MIEITRCDLVKLAIKAYELSDPQGMGVMHYKPEPLTEEDARSLISNDDPWSPLMMDYVRGRAVKLTVIRKDKKLFLEDLWYDHTDRQYKELLSAIDVKVNEFGEHNISCNCNKCREERE